MANVLPNILDIALRSDPDGSIAIIAETLSQTNQVLQDMIWQEANGQNYHTCTVRTGLPQGTWRAYNQGVSSTKSTTSQYQFACAQLRDYSYVDKTLADLGGNTEKWRLSEDMAHIEGISQQMSSTIFYGNQSTVPGQFTGLANYYYTTNLAYTQLAKNVVSAGGSASANSSIYLMGWGDRSVHGIYPKGMPAGLVYKNMGDIIPQYDSNGNRFETYTSMFEWNCGIAIPDWRYTARIANIDTTSNAGGIFSTTAPDLNAYMIKAVHQLPTTSRRLSGITETDAPNEIKAGTNPAIYMNRYVSEAFQLQAIRNKNVLLTPKEYAGEVVQEWRGMPVRIVDALLSTEASM